MNIRPYNAIAFSGPIAVYTSVYFQSFSHDGCHLGGALLSAIHGATVFNLGSSI